MTFEGAAIVGSVIVYAALLLAFIEMLPPALGNSAQLGLLATLDVRRNSAMTKKVKKSAKVAGVRKRRTLATTKATGEVPQAVSFTMTTAQAAIIAGVAAWLGRQAFSVEVRNAISVILGDIDAAATGDAPVEVMPTEYTAIAFRALADGLDWALAHPSEGVSGDDATGSTAGDRDDDDYSGDAYDSDAIAALLFGANMDADDDDDADEFGDGDASPL